MNERLSPKTSRRPTPQSASPPERPTRHGSSAGLVVAVYGARTGVGVTSIATSLAQAFRSRDRPDVALAELDPRAVRIRSQALRRAGSGVGAVADGTDRDRVLIPDVDAAIVRQPDGVWTLAMTGPRTPAVGDAKAVAIALDLLRSRFPVSVVELEHQVNERTLAAFDAADRILLVTEGSVPSVRGTQRVLQLCRRLNYPDEKMCVVLNRVGAPGSLPAEDVSAALKREIFWRIADRHLTTTALAERLLAE
jgi:pilus assembly protein CpaE